MFALFYNLYYAMFRGGWYQNTLTEINNVMKTNLNALGKLITSIFGEFQVTDFGDTFSSTEIIQVASYVLALITSIGIVVMAVKGVKKAFGIFFGHIR